MNDNKVKKKSNRLINETSPYLLQHSYNPVEWYPYQSSREIIVIEGEDKIEFKNIKKLILENYDQNTILIYSDGFLAENLTHLKDKGRIENRTTVYICENFTCKAPISTFEDLQKVLLPAQN